MMHIFVSVQESSKRKHVIMENDKLYPMMISNSVVINSISGSLSSITKKNSTTNSVYERLERGSRQPVCL